MAKKTAEGVRKELPKKEIIWVRQHALSGNQFLVTSAPDRAVYNLYQVCEEGYIFLGKDKSPKILYELIERVDPTAAGFYEDEKPRKAQRR